MYKLDKTAFKKGKLEDLEKDKVFGPEVSLGERLQQSWFLTCAAYGIDPLNPPKMIKELTGVRKHER